MTGQTQLRHVVAWLPAVRWATCFALWAVFGLVWLLPDLDLPLRTVVPFALAAAICRTSVLALRPWRLVEPWILTASLVADSALLTGLLDITGGPFNPFIVMYVAYVWTAATVSLPAAVLVGAMSATGFGWLVVDHLPVGMIEHHRLNDLPTHLVTTWFAGAAVAELVAYYVARAQVALAQRQQWLEHARERAARSERLAALTTVAAGAAHELSTPLGTIAVSARELERSAARLSESGPMVDVISALRDDARLVRMEVDRCQVILDGMSGRAGGGVPPVPLSPAAVAELAQNRLSEEQRRRLRVEIGPDAALPDAGGAEIVQALSSLLKNAFDASSASDDVLLRIVRSNGMLRIEVHDHGTGMSAEVRRRAGEPFYTTKEPGKGMGLGLFLARTIAERAGGSLRFEDEHGTTAVLEIPVDVTRVVPS